MATTLASCDDETEKRSVVAKPAQTAHPTSAKKPSGFYIIAPLDDEIATPAVYALDAVPTGVFLAWLDDVVEAEKRYGLTLSVIIRGYDPLDAARFLDGQDIDMSKYLFTRHEDAEQALATMKSRREGEGSEGCNGEL